MSELRQIDFRANCLKLADYLEHVKPNDYNHSEPESKCGSPCCSFGHAKLAGIVPIEACFFESDEYFGLGSYREIFAGSAFLDEFGMQAWADRVTPGMAANRLREFADAAFPAEPLRVLPSGSEICRTIIAKPFNEKETAHAA